MNRYFLGMSNKVNWVCSLAPCGRHGEAVRRRNGTKINGRKGLDYPILIGALGALGLPLLLGACAAPYRAALKEYGRAETTPFFQETIDWIQEADARTTGAQAFERLAVSPATAPSALAAEDAFLALAAQFYGVAPDVVRRRFEALDQPEELARALADRLAWEEIKFAVALYNPAVRAERERREAVLRQYEQAEFLEALLREFRAYSRYLNVETGEALQRGMIQEILPYPAAITLRGEMIREAVRMAEIDWQRMLRENVVEAGNAFFAYQYQRRALAAARENVALAHDLVEVIEARFEVGEASLPDLLKAQTELDRMRNAEGDFQAQARASAAQLNAILDRPADAPLGPPEDADLPDVKLAPDALRAATLQRRQEIRIQEARIAESSLAIRMAEIMNRPPATQGASFFERGMMPEAAAGPAEMPFGTRRIAPQPRAGFAQAESFIAEMRQRLAAEQATLEQLRAQARGLVAALVEDLDVARRQLALVRDVVLPQTQATYDTILDNYMAGAASFLDLLDAQRALIAARLEREEARRELNEALLRIVSVRGTL